MAKRKQSQSDHLLNQAEWLNWSEIEPDLCKIGNSSSRALHMETGGIYKVRLIGNPVRCFKYIANGKTAITHDPDSCPITRKYTWRPIRRYAINAIDRAVGCIQILEGTLSLFLRFRRFYDETGENPGGPQGCDFEIHVIGQPKGASYLVHYDPKKITPFTSPEKIMIRDQMFDLAAIYRATPDNEIEQRLGLRS